MFLGAVDCVRDQYSIESVGSQRSSPAVLSRFGGKECSCEKRHDDVHVPACQSSTLDASLEGYKSMRYSELRVADSLSLVAASSPSRPSRSFAKRTPRVCLRLKCPRKKLTIAY